MRINFRDKERTKLIIDQVAIITYSRLLTILSFHHLVVVYDGIFKLVSFIRKEDVTPSFFALPHQSGPNSLVSYSRIVSIIYSSSSACMRIQPLYVIVARTETIFRVSRRQERKGFSLSRRSCRSCLPAVGKRACGEILRADGPRG